MMTEETLEFISKNMWMLTYEEVQQLHQVLVTEWTFDNPSNQVNALVAEAMRLTEQRQNGRKHPEDQRLIDVDRVIMRGASNKPDIAGWGRLAGILVDYGVTISEMEDYPSGRRSQ